jgi:hypothetical protein
MCVAIACREELPSYDTLKHCEEANGDGGGIAWLEKGMVRWQKNLKAKEIRHLIDEREIKPPCLIHFRIATAGGKRPELCHPFPISRQAPTALAGTANAVLVHNGHWWHWGTAILEDAIASDRQVAKGPWSDSRAMAWMAARNGFEVLNFIADQQRIGVLEKSGRITLWGDWKQHKDYGATWFSNLTWHWRTNKESWNDLTTYGNYAQELGNERVWSKKCSYDSKEVCPHVRLCYGHLVHSADPVPNDYDKDREVCIDGRGKRCIHLHPCGAFLSDDDRQLLDASDGWWEKLKEVKKESSDNVVPFRQPDLVNMSEEEVQAMIREVELEGCDA